MTRPRVLISGGPLKNKRGHGHLTNDRVLFMDQRFNPTQADAIGGWLAGALAEQLEKRRKERPRWSISRSRTSPGSRTSRS